MEYQKNSDYQTLDMYLTSTKIVTELEIEKLNSLPIKLIESTELLDLVDSQTLSLFDNYMREDKFKTHFSSDINFEEFHRKQALTYIITDLKLPQKSINIIENAIKEVKNNLIKSNMSVDIMPSLYVDAEDTNWKELKLTIPIDKEKYSTKLEYKIIENILSGLDEKIAKQTIVDVRPY